MIEVTLLDSAKEVRQAKNQVLALCKAHGFSTKRSHEVATALEEALSNAVQHGHGGDISRPIRLRAFPDHESIVIEVTDCGHGLPEIPSLPDLSRKLEGRDRPTGWGIFLMRSLASELTFIASASNGHVARMRFGPVAPGVPVVPRQLEEHDAV